ncbi:hypothetical protein ACHAPT_002933 [Fusarium lateritium]
MQSPDPKFPSGRFTRLILRVLLVIFNIASFVTFILAAIAAGGDWSQMQESAVPDTVPIWLPPTFEGRPLVRRDDDDSIRGSFPPFTRDDLVENFVQITNRFDPNDPAWLPFFFLSAIAFISWVATAILLFYVFARGRRLGNRLARYIFRVIALIVLTFAPVFIFGWYRNDGSFSVVCKSGNQLGQTALVIAHFTLLLGIFLTLISAILDLPPDFNFDSRRTSLTSSTGV